MTIRLVDSGWSGELTRALKADASALRIISPFIKVDAVERLLALKPEALQVITRFNLADFAAGVSDIAALRSVLAVGGRVRGIRGLHSKLYLFGGSRAVVTSANLTGAALDRNQEFGAVTEDEASIAACQAYFDRLWKAGRTNLTEAQLDEWQGTVAAHLALGWRKPVGTKLGDFGAAAGFANPTKVALPDRVAEARQAFVKFQGESHKRALLSRETVDELKSSGCHRVVAYPASRRPRKVKDGALMFIARITAPNDITIFGRAIGMRHVPDRDDATPEDVARYTWRAQWSHYVRVHHAEFVAGTLENGVSLNELMGALGSDSFASTQRNAKKGEGNTNPAKAYRQQPAVELTALAMAWLNEELQAAFDRHGTVPQAVLDALDGPLPK